MKKNMIFLAAFIGTLGLSACEVEMADTGKKGANLTQPKPFGPYNGSYRGRTGALSQGLSTDCDIDLDISQTDNYLEIKALEYTCDDGTTWGFHDPMIFELRKSKDRTQLAYDVYRNGTYVGFQNYSNNYALLNVSDLGGNVTIALSQSQTGLRLENYQVSSNNWILFKPTAADLSKK